MHAFFYWAVSRKDIKDCRAFFRLPLGIHSTINCNKSMVENVSRCIKYIKKGGNYREYGIPPPNHDDVEAVSNQGGRPSLIKSLMKLTAKEWLSLSEEQAVDTITNPNRLLCYYKLRKEYSKSRTPADPLPPKPF